MSDGWCTLAKINSWIGVVASVGITYIVFRYMNANQQPDNPLREVSRKLFFAALGITAVFSGMLFLLYAFPQYCHVVGIVTAVMFVVLAAVGLMYPRPNTPTTGPNPPSDQGY